MGAIQSAVLGMLGTAQQAVGIGKFVSNQEQELATQAKATAEQKEQNKIQNQLKSIETKDKINELESGIVGAGLSYQEQKGLLTKSLGDNKYYNEETVKRNVQDLEDGKIDFNALLANPDYQSLESQQAILGMKQAYDARQSMIDQKNAYTDLYSVLKGGK